MLNNIGFDLWADEYDKTVGISDEEQSYPFAGYKKVLAQIYQTVMEKTNAKVLDIGFGTAVLTSKLYEHGFDVWGQDFSAKMLELAKSKMPNAHLFKGDFSNGLVTSILNNSFDFIVATYSLHHLADDDKIKFIKSLLKLLKRDGQILIGDVAFFDRHCLEQCREMVGDEWDDDEEYFVYDELKKVFPNLKFQQISFCSGVISLS